MPSDELFELVRRFTVARLLERDDFTKRMRRGRSRSRPSSCSIRCSRDTTRSRSRPTSSSAAPTRSSTCCSRATSRPPTACRRSRSSRCRSWPGTDGTRKMSKSLRQLRRRHRPAGGDVREADEHPGRGDGASTTCCCSARPLDPGAPPRRGQARARPAPGRPLLRRGSGGRRRGARSTASTCTASCRRKSRRPVVSAGGPTGPSTCRRSSPTQFGLSRSEARRLIEQGGVRLDGERRGHRRRSTCRPRGWTARCCRSASAVHGFASPAGLDGAARLVARPGSPALFAGGQLRARHVEAVRRSTHSARRSGPHPARSAAAPRCG